MTEHEYPLPSVGFNEALPARTPHSALQDLMTEKYNLLVSAPVKYLFSLAAISNPSSTALTLPKSSGAWKAALTFSGTPAALPASFHNPSNDSGLCLYTVLLSPSSRNSANGGLSGTSPGVVEPAWEPRTKLPGLCASSLRIRVAALS